MGVLGRRQDPILTLTAAGLGSTTTTNNNSFKKEIDLPTIALDNSSISPILKIHLSNLIFGTAITTNNEVFC